MAKKTLNAFGYRNPTSFIKLDHGLLKTDAWQTLSPDGTKVLLDLWSRHNGQNNGKIAYSRDEAHQLLRLAHGCNVSTRRANAALKEIQEKGFAVVTKASSFNLKTKESRTWRLTAERAGSERPTRDFRDWKFQNTGTTTVPDGDHHGPRDPAGEARNQPHGDHHGPCNGSLGPHHGDHHGPTYNIPVRGEVVEGTKAPPVEAWARWPDLTPDQRRGMARQEREAATARLHAVVNDPTYKAIVTTWNTLALFYALVIAEAERRAR